jgi:hypothetical protein
MCHFTDNDFLKKGSNSRDSRDKWILGDDLQSAAGGTANKDDCNETTKIPGTKKAH